MFSGLDGIGDAKQFNRIFLKKLDEPGGLTKSATAVRTFIQMRIRERGFARHILPPEVVTADDCERSETHDMLTKLIDREYDNTMAMAANFLGSHDGRFVEGDRVRASFYKIETLEYAFQEALLLANNYPITEVIEKHSIKDIERVEDEKMIELANAAVATTGKLIVSPVSAIDKQVLATLFKMIDGDELTFDLTLMHKVDFDDWNSLPATTVGDKLAGETSVDGWQYEKLQGHKVVTTIKNVIQPGHLYGFTVPETLGVFYLLGDTRFAIKKDYEKIFMKSWEYLAMLFVNVRACCKLEMNVPNPLTGP